MRRIFKFFMMQDDSLCKRLTNSIKKRNEVYGKNDLTNFNKFKRNL